MNQLEAVRLAEWIEHQDPQTQVWGRKLENGDWVLDVKDTRTGATAVLTKREDWDDATAAVVGPVARPDIDWRGVLRDAVRALEAGPVGHLVTGDDRSHTIAPDVLERAIDEVLAAQAADPQPPVVEPLRLTREMILEEARDCDALADKLQQDADGMWETDPDGAVLLEASIEPMRRSARWYRAYADSPDGYPPPEEPDARGTPDD